MMFSEEVMLETHLGYNCYPPMVHMLECAKQAIEFCKNEEYGALVRLPTSVNPDGYVRAEELVDNLHLWEFVHSTDEETEAYLDCEEEQE